MRMSGLATKLTINETMSWTMLTCPDGPLYFTVHGCTLENKRNQVGIADVNQIVPLQPVRAGFLQTFYNAGKFND